MPLTGGTRDRFLPEGANTPAWNPDGSRLVYFFEPTNGDPMFVADRTGAPTPGSTTRAGSNRVRMRQQSGVVAGRAVDLLRARRSNHRTDERRRVAHCVLRRNCPSG